MSNYNRKLRRLLNVPKGLVIHHKDNNKSNNDLSNIMIITKRRHDYIHTKGHYIEGEEEYKICEHCKSGYPLSMFRKRHDKNFGYESMCRPCKRAYDRAYRAKKKEMASA